MTAGRGRDLVYAPHGRCECGEVAVRWTPDGPLCRECVQWGDRRIDNYGRAARALAEALRDRP